MNRVCLIVGLALSCMTLSAQSFSIEVSSDSVLLGNYIEVSFKLKNIKGQFEAPTFDGFTIISGPNMSSSMQIINGDMSSTQAYSYYVQPNDIGLYTIAPAYLDTEGSTIETNPTEVNVYPNPNNIIQAPRRESGSSFFDFGDSPFGDSPFFKREQAPLETTPQEKTKPKRKYKRI